MKSKLTLAIMSSHYSKAKLRRWKNQAGQACAAVGHIPFAHRSVAELPKRGRPVGSGWRDDFGLE